MERQARRGDLLAARWVGTGTTDDGPMRFTGNDLLRLADGQFVEYWTGTSTGGSARGVLE